MIPVGTYQWVADQTNLYAKQKLMASGVPEDKVSEKFVPTTADEICAYTGLLMFIFPHFLLLLCTGLRVHQLTTHGCLRSCPEIDFSNWHNISILLIQQKLFPGVSLALIPSTKSDLWFLWLRIPSWWIIILGKALLLTRLWSSARGIVALRSMCQPSRWSGGWRCGLSVIQIISTCWITLCTLERSMICLLIHVNHLGTMLSSTWLGLFIISGTQCFLTTTSCLSPWSLTCSVRKLLPVGLSATGKTCLCLWSQQNVSKNLVIPCGGFVLFHSRVMMVERITQVVFRPLHGLIVARWHSWLRPMMIVMERWLGKVLEGLLEPGILDLLLWRSTAKGTMEWTSTISCAPIMALNWNSRSGGSKSFSSAGMHLQSMLISSTSSLQQPHWCLILTFKWGSSWAWWMATRAESASVALLSRSRLACISTLLAKSLLPGGREIVLCANRRAGWHQQAMPSRVHLSVWNVMLPCAKLSTGASGPFISSTLIFTWRTCTVTFDTHHRLYIVL